jgi:SPP1 gp7 family putative phage head morphogenesis protein
MTGKGMTFDQAFDASDASTARYQARIQRLRAETIARTETLRAARQGQKESYTQARQQGFMQFTVLEWSTSEDDRVCEICGPLNGEQIPMDGQFPGVDDWTDGAHVNCRCEAIPVDPPVDADLATMTDEEIAGEIEALIDGGSTVIPVSPDSGAARTAAEYPIEQIRALDDEGIAMQREAHRIVQERTGKRSDGYLNPEEHPVEAEMYIRGQEIRNESRDLQARFLNESFTTVTEYGVGDEFRRFTDEGNNTRDKYVVEDEKTLSMNRGLRGGRAATARAKAVDDMIAEHSVAQPTRVYRGALLDDSAVATFTPGSTFNDKGFQSADLERSGAEFYANARAEQGIQGKPVLFEVTITPETKAAYVGVGEVVIGRGASMEVLATREEDGFLVVEVVAKHV